MIKINSLNTLFRIQVDYADDFEITNTIIVDVDFENRMVIFSDEDKKNLGEKQNEISELIFDRLMPEVAESPQFPPDLINKMNELKIQL